MATMRTNADRVAAWLEQVVAGFDFTRPGVDRSVGEDLAAEAARAMIDRAVPDMRAPDGSTWAPNEPSYAAFKRRYFDSDQPGILTGQMLSFESMYGRPVISADRIELVYGTGERPGPTARSGAAVPEYLRRATDREKAQHFTASGREFYGFDATVADRIIAVAAEAWESYLTGMGAT